MPSPNLNLIKTIVVVMMENRSFDHLLGYLSMSPYNWPNVDGLRDDVDWMKNIASTYNGVSFPPFLLNDPYDLIAADPPHERDDIALQMGTPVNRIFPMNGFVTNYTHATAKPQVNPGDQPPVMGYFTADQVPVTDFFAQNFAICDHWFSSLPAGTQPNRLMSMSGFSKIDVNHHLLPEQELVYDWLTKRGIRWRVYHEGMPFFVMMPRWIPDILGGTHFRPLAELWDDVQNELPDEFPQVIFVEPMYTDAPHIGLSSDDHAPSAVKGGQQFLLEVYRAMSLEPDVWNSTVMIVDYDEHGGFFDHVSPPVLHTELQVGTTYRNFETLGVRVPGFVLSPFVKPKTVFNGLLDHTSVLKFIAQKFGDGEPYSDLVERRAVGSILDVLNLDSARTDIPVPEPLTDYLSKQPPAAGYTPGEVPVSAISQGFKDALDNFRHLPPEATVKFDDLLKVFPPA